MPDNPEFRPEITAQARNIFDGEMTFEQTEEALIRAIGTEREQFWRDTLYAWSTMEMFKDDRTLKAELYNVGTTPEQMKEIFEKAVPLFKLQQKMDQLGRAAQDAIDAVQRLDRAQAQQKHLKN